MATWRDYQLTQDYQKRMMLRAAQERLGAEVLALRPRHGGFRPLMARIGDLLATWGCALQTRYSELDIANIAQRCRTEDSLAAELEKIFASN